VKKKNRGEIGRCGGEWGGRGGKGGGGVQAKVPFDSIIEREKSVAGGKKKARYHGNRVRPSKNERGRSAALELWEKISVKVHSVIWYRTP